MRQRKETHILHTIPLGQTDISIVLMQAATLYWGQRGSHGAEVWLSRVTTAPSGDCCLWCTAKVGGGFDALHGDEREGTSEAIRNTIGSDSRSLPWSRGQCGRSLEDTTCGSRSPHGAHSPGVILEQGTALVLPGASGGGQQRGEAGSAWLGDAWRVTAVGRRKNRAGSFLAGSSSLIPAGVLLPRRQYP